MLVLYPLPLFCTRPCTLLTPSSPSPFTDCQDGACRGHSVLPRCGHSVPPRRRHSVLSRRGHCVVPSCTPCPHHRCGNRLPRPSRDARFERQRGAQRASAAASLLFCAWQHARCATWQFVAATFADASPAPPRSSRRPRVRRRRAAATATVAVTAIAWASTATPRVRRCALAWLWPPPRAVRRRRRPRLSLPRPPLHLLRLHSRMSLQGASLYRATRTCPSSSTRHPPVSPQQLLALSRAS